MSSETKEIQIATTVFVTFLSSSTFFFCHHYIPNNYNTTNFFRDIMSYSNEPPSVFECLVKTAAKSARCSIFSLSTQAVPVGNYPGKWQRMIGIFNRMFRNVVVNYGTHFRIFCLFVYFSTPCCVHLLLFILCYVISQPLCNRKSH